MVEAGFLDAVEVHLQLLDVGHGLHVVYGLDVQLLAQLDANHLLVLKVNHLLGAAHDGRGIGGDVILALADTNHHGATLACGNQLVGVAFLDNGNGIGAHDMVQGDAHGLEEVDMLALLHVFDEVGEHLGVGRRQEGEPAFLQFLAQTQVVLDDAVMDQGQVARLRAVRVGVHLVRLAVGGPAGVGDADMAAHVFGSGKGLQVGDLAFSFVNIQFVGLVEQRHTSAVVATIFEALQALNEDRIGLLRAYISNYSTHIFCLLEVQKYVFEKNDARIFCF